MKMIFLQFLCCLGGAYGFCEIFRVKKDKMFVAVIGGGISGFVYLYLTAVTNNKFLSCLIAAALSAFYAEVMARVCKAPVTIFTIPALIPLIPGGSLYYTMENLVQKNNNMLREKAIETTMFILAIVLGITIIIMVLDIFSLIMKKMKQQKIK